MSTDAAAITPGCVLAPVTEVVAKHCVWCGNALGKGLRRWCSQTCVALFLDNHEWSAARFAAIRRASVVEPVTRVWGEQDVQLGPWCDQCGQRCDLTKPNEWGGRYVPQDWRPEVNHVDPRIGAVYDKGCWNHQTNLQVLCHACHVAETARQGRERKVVGWPGAEPHHTWRTLGWTWPEAARFIEAGAYPVREVEQAPRTEMLTLWEVA